MTTQLGKAMVYAFSHGTVGGNPSFVIATSGIPADLTHECVAEAQARKCEVTHIHFGDDRKLADLRFYVASGPNSFCGHGALAAGAWAQRAGLMRDVLHLNFGTGALTLISDTNTQSLGFLDDSGPLIGISINEKILFTLKFVLGLHELSNHDTKLWKGGNKRVKAVISLSRIELLQNIKIDSGMLDSFCSELGVTGIYLYVYLDTGRLAARHYPAYAAGSEDLATGNMAATMARHTSVSQNCSLRIEQGGSSCDAALLQAQRQDSQWLVSGECWFETSDH